mgnify:CR=1 FL=1
MTSYSVDLLSSSDFVAVDHKKIIHGVSPSWLPRLAVVVLTFSKLTDCRSNCKFFLRVINRDRIMRVLTGEKARKVDIQWIYSTGQMNSHRVRGNDITDAR